MPYSVLMAVYRKEKPEFLKIAIQSMLDQTVPTDDFVLVCDGPLTQELDAVIDRFCTTYPALFHVVRMEKNMGLGLALNAGIQECKNEYVARMDSDDISLPDRIEKQLKVFELDASLSVVGAQIAEFQNDPAVIEGYRVVPTAHNKILKRVKTRSPMNHVTVLMKRSDVLAVGNYEGLVGYEDYHLWIKMLSAGKVFANIDDVGCNVRVDGMYKRRGGMAYFKNYKKLQELLLAEKLITYPRYMMNACVRFGATVVCPNFLRKILFKKLMRKRKINRG